MKIMPEIYFDGLEKSLSCDTSNWTEFYSVSIGDAGVLRQVEEIMIAIGHNHFIRIELDGEVFIDSDVSDLSNILVKSKAIDFNIDMIKNGSNYDLFFKFDDVFVDNIKVFCKRRSGHGKLKMDGVLVNYLKRVE